jgi:hypothetical protein
LTVQARINRDRLKDNILVHMSAELKTELNSPQMLTLDLTVHMIWTRATPNTVTPDNCIEAVT